MKTAFITGAGRGLGKGFTEYFLSEGYAVFAGVRDPSRVDKKLQTNDNFKIIPIDVSDDKSIEKAFSLVKRETNHLNYLVNSAGINKDSATNHHKDLVCKLSDLDRKSLLKMFNTNSISPMIILKKFLPLLTSTPSFVINVSSCRSSYHDEFENPNGNYGYRGSKIALNMMTFCSMKDLPANIKTYAVHPGSVKTDMNPTGTDLPFNQAKHIVEISYKWNDKFNGKFLRYDGSPYPL